jgi:hypothetical protein
MSACLVTPVHYLRAAPSSFRWSSRAMGGVAVSGAATLSFRHLPAVDALSSPNASQCLAGGSTMTIAVKVRSLGAPCGRVRHCWPFCC